MGKQQRVYCLMILCTGQIFAITEVCVMQKEKLKALIYPIFFLMVINKFVTEKKKNCVWPKKKVPSSEVCFDKGQRPAAEKGRKKPKNGSSRKRNLLLLSYFLPFEGFAFVLGNSV